MIDKGYDKGNEYLSDHPSLKSRVDAAHKRAKDLGPDARRDLRPPVASGSQFRDIQRRAEEIGRTMPDDKSLAQSQELLQALPRSCLTPAVQEDQKAAQRHLQQELEAKEQRGGAAPADQPSGSKRRKGSSASQ
jgi:hypothetical protein